MSKLLATIAQVVHRGSRETSNSTFRDSAGILTGTAAAAAAADLYEKLRNRKLSMRRDWGKTIKKIPEIMSLFPESNFNLTYFFNRVLEHSGDPVGVKNSTLHEIFVKVVLLFYETESF